MNLDLATLKDFVDLGGVFILALVVLYCHLKQLSSMDEKLTKVLTLLSILVKTQTNFNGVEKVLGKEGEVVAKMIIDSEKETP